MDSTPAWQGNALVYGNHVFYPALYAKNKSYVFKPEQMQFLYALQQMKSVHAAALSVGKDEAWADKFLSSRKFKSFRNAKISEMSVKNGLTIEWWYDFGKKLTDGQTETWEGDCKVCEEHYVLNDYDVEESRSDEMKLETKCPVCFTPMAVTHETKEFKPSREQVEAWKELGARLTPKIERVHHQFENVDIVFENSEGGIQP